MKSTGQGIGKALLVILTCYQSPVVDAASQSSKTIKHLFDITESNIGALVLPTDVEVDQSRIYIVDSGNNRLVVLGKDGKTQFIVGREGKGDGEFQDPVGLGVDHEGLIYVADTGNHRIQIFTADGEFSSAFPVTSSGKPIRPIDVAVDPKNHHLFVTGNNNHKVMVFERSGRMVREWGGNGAQTGSFRYPATIAVTGDLDVAVVDVFNTRIQLFEPNGDFRVAIGEWGVLPGRLFRPKGVAIDRQGYIYVSDSYMNLIQVFNDSGEFLHWLKPQNSSYEMVTPAGIAVAGKNRLYVAEMLKHRISVFQID